jgi:very-short-patch-repair endonuclease
MRRLTPVARNLRRSRTEAESRLWYHLRNRQIEGMKFRFQSPVAGYVADFLCAEARLIIEVDGGQHAIRAAQDAERTRTLEMAGYSVLRFWNNDVLSNTDGVIETIRLAILNALGRS